MKLRKICFDCIGKQDCEKSNESNWEDCRGKSKLKKNIKLFNTLSSNSKMIMTPKELGLKSLGGQVMHNNSYTIDVDRLEKAFDIAIKETKKQIKDKICNTTFYELLTDKHYEELRKCLK
jgi:hypothetical protein